ncbi:hypothetical protein [Anabaena azotica]|uniref:Uncharacterized protein n=1 Tax=Anabaena azotica FACHB-119 TaxID=947527 RepID=A0ABR8CZ94_9NOST|nr:hypothetical protein [Anabaena azotica]MBD2500162.1 hypothetical protein [Anabaena azotica FACHB-119]
MNQMLDCWLIYKFILATSLNCFYWRGNRFGEINRRYTPIYADKICTLRLSKAKVLTDD